MNKRHGLIAVALVALLLATSCSTFFTGGVSGKVKCNGEPVARATVALYFDEGTRNGDFDRKDKVFNTQYKAETQDNGAFAITNIPWNEAFPDYGKDADTQTAYAIIYHEDYGYKKVDGISVISGRSNEIFPEFEKKLTETKRITVNFKQSANDLAANGITHFKYSYAGRPGYGTELYKGEADVANGSATLNIRYQGELPKINIYDIQAAEYDGAGMPFTLTVGDDMKRKDSFDNLEIKNGTITINTVPYKYRFPGFDGTIKPTPVKEQVKVELKDQDGKLIDAVMTYAASDRIERYENFRNLGDEIILVNTPVDGVYKKTIEAPYKIYVDGSVTPNDVTASSDTRASRIYSVTK